MKRNFSPNLRVLVLCALVLRDKKRLLIQADNCQGGDWSLYLRYNQNISQLSQDIRQEVSNEGGILHEDYKMSIRIANTLDQCDSMGHLFLRKMYTLWFVSSEFDQLNQRVLHLSLSEAFMESMLERADPVLLCYARRVAEAILSAEK